MQDMMNPELQKQVESQPTMGFRHDLLEGPSMRHLVAAH